MNKKGISTGAVIGIAIAIVFVVGVIIVLFVLGSKGFFDRKEEVIMMPLFMIPRDQATLQPVEANYILEYVGEENARMIVSQGRLDDGWNELSVPRDIKYQFTCWDDGKYYLVKAHKQNAPEEIQNNKSTFTCDMERIGNISISHTGDFKNTLSIIQLNITTHDSFYKTSFCFAWTSGILDVTLRDQYATCDKGSWKNWSKYDAEKKEFTYLPAGEFICGEINEPTAKIERCLFAEGTKCRTISEEIPKRFRNIADSCAYSGKTIRNQTVEFELEVVTDDYKNILDKIQIYVYDKERVWSDTEQMHVWQSEINGGDIGAPDVTYEIEYEQ